MTHHGHSSWSIGVVVALAVVLLASAGSTWTSEQGEILLEDQFGKKDGPSRHRGGTVLLLYAEPPALRRMKAWELAILDGSHAPPRILRAVDARSVRGKKTEEEVCERLKKNVPQDVSILIDWAGDLTRAYALPEAEVSVTVLDPGGRACGTLAGPVSPELLGRALELISRVNDGGKCP